MISALSHSPVQIPGIVERIRLVPDSARYFSESPADVGGRHRIGSALLDQLLDLGLPHRGTGSERRYDKLDLANVGLELNLRCPQRLAMRWWSKAMAQAAELGEAVYAVELSAPCPSPGHPGECRLELSRRFVDAACPGTVRPAGDGTWTFDVRMMGRTLYFGDTYTELLDSVRPLRFHLLPYPVNTDLGFLAGTGLADCRLAATYLIHRGGELGLPVRPVAGYILAPPYAALHVWIELEVGGAWWAADPMLLNAFARWGIGDAEQWPPHRSPQGLLWRVHDRFTEPVSHNGHMLVPTLGVRP